MTRHGKTALTILLILATAAVAAAATAYYYQKKVVPVSSNKDETDAPNPKIVNLPVPLGTPNVGLMFVHYFFSGSIKELKKTDSGTQIILDTPNKDIPEIIATQTTTIAKVTIPAPATPVPPKPMNVSELKAGHNVDVSMEFDPVLKHWVLLGVFLPSNKNP